MDVSTCPVGLTGVTGPLIGDDGVIGLDGDGGDVLDDAVAGLGDAGR